MSDDLQRFKDELIEDLLARQRVEMMALHLGDDMMVSEEEAAALLGVHPKTLYRQRVAGEIPFGMFSGRPVYSMGMIRRIMREATRPKRA